MLTIGSSSFGSGGELRTTGCFTRESIELKHGLIEERYEVYGLNGRGDTLIITISAEGDRDAPRLGLHEKECG